MTVEANFAAIDDLWYGDTQSTIAQRGTGSGRLHLPREVPLTTSAESDRSQVFTGRWARVATWGVYEIAGPVLSRRSRSPASLATRLRSAPRVRPVADDRHPPWARGCTATMAHRSAALSTPRQRCCPPPRYPPGGTNGAAWHHYWHTRATATWRDAFTTP